jgi:hypothetical protein
MYEEMMRGMAVVAGLIVAGCLGVGVGVGWLLWG